VRDDAAVDEGQQRDLWTFYDEVRDFQVRLSGLGHAEAADALDRAIYGSSPAKLSRILG
jgi:hypothetical protein